MGWITRLVWKIIKNHMPKNCYDIGVWNTNAIHEFEKSEEVELHVISPCSFLKNRLQEFNINNIHYHFFRDERNQLINSIYIKVFAPTNYQYKSNRCIVKSLIKKIEPDIVHLIGAENPQYSITLLDIPKAIPTIVQLQTLMNDLEFKDNYPITKESYLHRSSIEKTVLLRADYIGTKEEKYKNIISQSIKPFAQYVNTSLAVAEEIKIDSVEKRFDFIYFANDISKAGDLALEAFGLAYKKKSNITLDIVGGYNNSFKQQLDEIVTKYGIADVVTFEGRLESHHDVMNQISKSRFALLPLRIDLNSGCIREAISKGLPVLTTDTGELGTQLFNSEKQCVLLSPKEDALSLSYNMLILLDDEKLAERLSKNAIERQKEKYNNEKVVREYIEVYKVCINNGKSL